MKRTNSHRHYHILCFNDLEEKFSSKFSLDELLGIDNWEHNDTELQYTLQEDIDNILDMRFSEEIVVSIDRSNQSKKGILKRIK